MGLTDKLKTWGIIVGAIAGTISVLKIIYPFMWNIMTTDLNNRIDYLERKVWELEHPGFIGPVPKEPYREGNHH